MDGYVDKPCYRYRGVLIPGCYSAALNTGACTCWGPKRRKTREEAVDARIAALEARVEKLEGYIEAKKEPTP